MNKLLPFVKFDMTNEKHTGSNSLLVPMACDEAALATKLVYHRSMGDICVVDFPSLLLIPMLQLMEWRCSSVL